MGFKHAQADCQHCDSLWLKALRSRFAAFTKKGDLASNTRHSFSAVAEVPHETIACEPEQNNRVFSFLLALPGPWKHLESTTLAQLSLWVAAYPQSSWFDLFWLWANQTPSKWTRETYFPILQWAQDFKIFIRHLHNYTEYNQQWNVRFYCIFFLKLLDVMTCAVEGDMGLDFQTSPVPLAKEKISFHPNPAKKTGENPVPFQSWKNDSHSRFFFFFFQNLSVTLKI